MKVLDLFSGIGGFSLGLEATGGFETVRFVENNEWCQKVLAKNFPGVPITGDIKNYEPKRSDGIGLVTGGIPCQPFSVAGKRKGTADDRHLWGEMLRVIKACKPRWAIVENVRGLITIQEGMVFEQICIDLENEGFKVQSFLIPASAVNAPHQRYRVWIVAHSDSIRNQSELRETSREGEGEKISNTKFSSRGDGRNTISSASRDEEKSTNVANSYNTGDRTPKHEIKREGEKIDKRWEGLSQSESSRLSKDVANSESNKQDGILRATESEHDKRNSRMESKCSSNRQSLRETTQDVADSKHKGLEGGITRNDKDRQEWESLQTVEQQSTQVWVDTGCESSVRRERMAHEGFSTEPSVGRVAHGISGRVDRLKGLGNAIVPQVIHQIGLAILEAEKNNNE